MEGGLRVRGGQNPENLEFGLKGMFSVVAVPSRGVGSLRDTTPSFLTPAKREL